MFSLPELRLLWQATPEDAQQRQELGVACYDLGVACYERQRLRAAALAFRRHLELVEQADLVRDRNTNGAPNEAGYAAFERTFRAFLDNTWAAWAAGSIPQPVLRGDGAQRRAPSDALRGLRVLAVTPQYIMASSRYIECDMTDHLVQSQVNAGIDVHQFFNDRIAYPVLKIDPVKAAEDLRGLRETVARLRPDVMLLDANFMPDEVTVNPAFLADIKATFGTKLIVFIGDAWGEVWVPVADCWGAVVDMILHIAPAGAVEQKSKFPEKLLCTPYPVNEQNFFRQEQRSLDLSFFGSYVSYLRPFWLTHARRAVKRLGLNGNLRAHQRTNDCPTMAEYGSIMRSSRMVLNCSSRYGRVKMMTGRVWQAIHSGAVLLEEDNELTKNFFVPFVHYVPYENARQLGHMIAFFARNRDYAARVGSAAAEFATRHYSSAAVWTRVYETLASRVGDLKAGEERTSARRNGG